MSRRVRRTAAAALMITWLQHPAAADPPALDVPHHDRAAAPTPWIDLGASPIISEANTVPGAGHKLAAALTLGGLYAGFTTWTYFAWYRKHKPLAQFAWGGDGWLGARTYAGGADKFGHAWATMSLAR